MPEPAPARERIPSSVQRYQLQDGGHRQSGPGLPSHPDVYLGDALQKSQLDRSHTTNTRWSQASTDTTLTDYYRGDPYKSQESLTVPAMPPMPSTAPLNVQSRARDTTFTQLSASTHSSMGDFADYYRESTATVMVPLPQPELPRVSGYHDMLCLCVAADDRVMDRRPCLVRPDDPTDRRSWCWNWEEPNLIMYHCSSRCHLSKWKVDMDTCQTRMPEGG